MASGQTIVDNGRVNVILQWILAICAPLAVAGIIGLVVLVFGMKDELQQANTIQSLHIQASNYEHTDIDRRLTAVERERDRARDDRRDK
jgi:hypothetical protein